jgi:lipoyl(octanoyl) transferase
VGVNELSCARLGQVPYTRALEIQRVLEEARGSGEIGDTLLLLEHPPVYTKGRRSEPAELGMGEDWYRMQGIEVVESDRGGRVTYHGPGQLVGYPITSLDGLGMGVVDYIRHMERVMIDTLGSSGVEAQVIDGLTGVWTAGPPPALDPHPAAARKIGSIGVHVRKGITTHGLAINVNNDLQPFEWIVPCGIDGCRMTSVCRELGGPVEMRAVIDTVCELFGAVYEREPVDLDAAALAERVPGLGLAAGAGASVG